MKTILTILGAGLLLAGHAHAQSQLLQLSPVQEDLAELRKNMAANSYYLGLAVDQINRTWAATWSKDTERLEALLNAIGAEKVGQLVALQAATGAEINGLLDATGSAGPRVQATPLREFTVDQTTGYITVVPLPEETAAPEEPQE